MRVVEWFLVAMVLASASAVGGCRTGRLDLSDEGVRGDEDAGSNEQPPAGDAAHNDDADAREDNDGSVDGGSGNGEVVDCTAAPTGGATLEVGPGRTYATIGAAVEAANAGDVVLVHAGTYAEQVEVDKAISIAPFGDGDVWIDGECATAHPNGIVIRAANVLVRCFGIRNTVDASIYIVGSDAYDVSIEGMALQDYQCMHNVHEGGQNQGGVAAHYTGPRIRVVGNTLRRRVDAPGDPRGMADGIWFKSNSAEPSGGGHYIAYNTIEGGRDGIGGENENDDHGSFDRDTIIEHNVVRGCDDDGIQVEGGDMNVIVRDNYIEGCPIGIGLAPVNTGPLTIERNVIENLVASSFGPGGRCFKVGDNGTATARLVRNVCRTTMGDGISQTNRGNNPFIVQENVFQVGRYVYEFSTSVPPSMFRRNCLHTTDPARFVKWANVTYPSLAAFQEALGQDEGSQQVTDCSWLDE